jgi:hypothetical protein
MGMVVVDSIAYARSETADRRENDGEDERERKDEEEECDRQ